MDEAQIKELVSQTLANSGFLTKQEFNSTAAMIRGLKESVDSIHGANPMEALVTAGLLEKAADGSYKAKTAALKKEATPEPEWQVQLRQMQEQMAAKDKALAAEKTKREEGELKAAVIAAFEKAGAVNANRDYVHVLPMVKRAEDGSFHAIKKDEFGVESKIGLDVAFGEFLGKNAELKKAQGHPGSGTPAGHQASGNNGTDINSLAGMSTEQYFALRRAGK